MTPDPLDLDALEAADRTGSRDWASKTIKALIAEVRRLRKELAEIEDRHALERQQDDEYEDLRREES